ncbi:MAG: hypothetical protein RLZZ546_3192 [Bacteroidota bacterium]|jgi:D-alanyl-D-alanine dipeptidase
MKVFILFVFLAIISCKNDKAKDQLETNVNKHEKNESVQENKEGNLSLKKDTASLNKTNESHAIEDKKLSKNNVDSNFDEISLVEDGIAIDIKYATKDNFTKKQIYPCGKCYLRPEAANRILQAQEILQTKYKLGLKMFDCYRPRPAQQRLWDVVPNPDYVTPPSKGSMHNRGLAVDLTLVDQNGKELDMGTPYDFFGKEAHTDNLNLPKNILENRSLLTSVMKSVGFQGIRTEWWHFSIPSSSELSDWEWDCN